MQERKSVTYIMLHAAYIVPEHAFAHSLLLSVALDV